MLPRGTCIAKQNCMERCQTPAIYSRVIGSIIRPRSLADTLYLTNRTRRNSFLPHNLPTQSNLHRTPEPMLDPVLRSSPRSPEALATALALTAPKRPARVGHPAVPLWYPPPRVGANAHTIRATQFLTPPTDQAQLVARTITSSWCFLALSSWCFLAQPPRIGPRAPPGLARTVPRPRLRLLQR